MSLLRLSRGELLDEYWDFRPGQHVVAIGPTGNGKSWLMWQLLQATMRKRPSLSYVSLMPKPADPTTAVWSRSLGMRETPVWPPVKKLLSGKPPGYVVWPPHAMGVPPAQRRQRVGDVLRSALNDQYRKGNSVTLLDDAHSAAVMMGLNEHLEELLVNGRAGGASAWISLQKPSGSMASGSVTSFAYSSATHLFLTRDNDERNVKRFGEIGGVDPKRIEDIVRNLRLYRLGDSTVSEILWVNLQGPYLALVSP